MMHEIVPILKAIADRASHLAQHDPELRHQLRQLAQAWLQATEQPQPQHHEEGTVAENGQDELAAADAVQATEPSWQELVDSCILGRAAPRATPTSWDFKPAAGGETDCPRPGASETVTDADLPFIEERLRLKAEGVRLAAAQDPRPGDAQDPYLETDALKSALIARAKSLPDCYLWMCNGHFTPPADPSLLDDAAGCLETTARALGLVREIMGDPADDQGSLNQALTLLAESQSALRSALDHLGGRTDIDQKRTYHWLRDMCNRMELYIPRFMQLDDQADPQTWSDIARRLNELSSQWQHERQRTRDYKKAINKISYHLKAIGKKRDDNVRQDWDKVIHTIHDLVQTRVPPSNPEIRQLLLPCLDDLPDMDMPSGFQRVLREIDIYLASRPMEARTADAPPPTAEVQQVAQLLANRSVVLIGGMRRLQAHEALKAAFNLKELDWVETREHASIVPFESHIARPEVALVILAIRWSSHAFGDIRKYCEKYGKPLLRLPAGYNPNQVAVQILSQCGDRLQMTA